LHTSHPSAHLVIVVLPSVPTVLKYPRAGLSHAVSVEVAILLHYIQLSWHLIGTSAKINPSANTAVHFEASEQAVHPGILQIAHVFVDLFKYHPVLQPVHAFLSAEQAEHPLVYSRQV
jgi:hypothetical protein